MARNALARLIGDKKLLKVFEELDKKMKRKVRNKVLRAGAIPMRKAVRREVPVDEGHLKKAIDYKIIKGDGGAVIGAKAGYKAGDDVPARYVHLVEFGHIAPNGTVVPGSHPIERGSQAAESESAKAMIDKAYTEINKIL